MAEDRSAMPISADQNLHFGILALQAGLLDALQFADARSAWATRMNGVLADLLVERGWLSADDRADVERLLERKLRKQSSRVVSEKLSGGPSWRSPVVLHLGLGVAILPTEAQGREKYLVGWLGSLKVVSRLLIPFACEREPYPW